MSSVHGSRSPGFQALASGLVEAFAAWGAGELVWDATLANHWVRLAFQVQVEGNQAYRRYCEARGVSLPDIESWRDVPAVPTAAFRAVDLVVGEPADARLTFRTSGTTGGDESRGRHLVRSPALYAASAHAGFRRFVLEGHEAMKLITLPPDFTFGGDSSLGWMLEKLRTGAGVGDGVSVATSAGIDWRMLDTLIEESCNTGRAVGLLGTTLGFAEWLGRMEEGRARSRDLPDGSLLMDTGGAKGRRGLDRGRVVRRLASRLGLGLESVINEFGMTELLSQRYARGDPPGPLLGPPWLRSRVLDPVTLEEVAPGEAGILSHFDLANLGSVCAVLTEDRGRVVGEGIEWIGRTPGAPPRGCSLATAELLEAQGHA